jgi:hypothetical protein
MLIVVAIRCLKEIYETTKNCTGKEMHQNK